MHATGRPSSSGARRRLTSGPSRFIEALLRRLLAHHVLGIPIWPVGIGFPSLCFMLSVSLRSANHRLGRRAPAQEKHCFGGMAPSQGTEKACLPYTACLSIATPFRASMALTLAINAFSKTLPPIVPSTRLSRRPLRFLPSRMTTTSMSVVPSG